MQFSEFDHVFHSPKKLIERDGSLVEILLWTLAKVQFLAKTEVSTLCLENQECVDDNGRGHFRTLLERVKLRVSFDNYYTHSIKY